MKQAQVHELLYQSLETELGGVEIYETALRCVKDEELREELRRYHEQTTRHVELVEGLLAAFGLDSKAESPGREVVHHIGASLVRAMEMALDAGPPEAAQLVAVECVTLAETKDHLNWELLGEVRKQLRGEQKAAVDAAYQEVEDEEDEHLYHSTGWARELWIDSLGLPAVLPPPEEQKDVTTAIGAARAKAAREKMA